MSVASLGSWESHSPHSSLRGLHVSSNCGLPETAASRPLDTGRWGWPAHHEVLTIPRAQSRPWVSPACPERSCVGKDIGPFPERPCLWAQAEGKSSSWRCVSSLSPSTLPVPRSPPALTWQVLLENTTLSVLCLLQGLLRQVGALYGTGHGGVVAMSSKSTSLRHHLAGTPRRRKHAPRTGLERQGGSVACPASRMETLTAPLLWASGLLPSGVSAKDQAIFCS